jgi:hypothetical protein
MCPYPGCPLPVNPTKPHYRYCTTNHKSLHEALNQQVNARALDVMRAAQRTAGNVAKAATLSPVPEDQAAPTAAASFGVQDVALAAESA